MEPTNKNYSLNKNKEIDKKCKNKHSRHGFRCRKGLIYGGWWTPDNLPSKPRRQAKNKQIRTYLRGWIDDEIERVYDTDPDPDDYEYEIEQSAEKWTCQHCTYSNKANHSFCKMCNMPSQCQPFEASNGLKIRHKYKRKRIKKKQTLKHVQTNEFETYWNEMKVHNDKVKKAAKRNAMRQLDDRKPLNFKLLILPYDVDFDKYQMKKYCIDMNDVLYTEDIKMNNVQYRDSSYDWYKFHVNFIIAHDSLHSHWKNFDVDKINISFFIYSYKWSYKNNYWFKSVKEWKAKNILKNKKEFILNKIYKKEGFEYLNDVRSSFDPNFKIEQKKKRMNVRINIKLDKCATVNAFDYKQNVQIDENLAFEQQSFKLTNFVLRECAVDLYQSECDEPKRINLKNENGKQIFIPIHVAKNEVINEMIAKRLKFKHRNCKIQQFASKIVEKLLVLQNNTRNKERETFWRNHYRNLRYSKQQKSNHLKITQKWRYDSCHNPNCNLLPLTCDLNRLLTDYMPYYDVLKDILLPYIGYSVFYYVRMSAKQIEYVSLRNDYNVSEDGFIDGFFNHFRGFNEQKIIVNEEMKQREIKIESDLSSESSSSVPAPMNLFGDNFWSDSD